MDLIRSHNKIFQDSEGADASIFVNSDTISKSASSCISRIRDGREDALVTYRTKEEMKFLLTVLKKYNKGLHKEVLLQFRQAVNVGLICRELTEDMEGGEPKKFQKINDYV